MTLIFHQSTYQRLSYISLGYVVSIMTLLSFLLLQMPFFFNYY